ncbi:hypothetical protein LUD75_11310 [Epilithonimonas sp. JDS]|uniref:hypothetical protein n=1 Tax=Epilithonimonas sp. JDS TaxID=2902797 RepID=UPI001E516F2B|nr:hypothetical protein [Epilithonimonas sp. JDS]MCD9855300.1 hypothetical protein [Epilithonimonas sp. JDS]
MAEIKEKDIADFVVKLIEIVNQNCWNTISQNLVFIISDIKEVSGINFFVERVNRNKFIKDKKENNLTETVNYLNKFSDNIYDLNLYIYKAEKDKTIIEIRYFLKSDLDPDYLKNVIDNKPMLHSKVTKPPYIKNNKDKFDINWELGGIRHQWKMLLWKMKII